MRQLLFRVTIFALFLLMASSASAVRLYLTEVAPFAFVVEGTNRYDGINIRIANELQSAPAYSLMSWLFPLRGMWCCFLLILRRTAFLTVKISRMMTA
jgi:ABC-type amino acid transport substrate-binding protein